MGQEQSYPSPASVTSRRYRDHKYEDPIQYRNTEEREREYKRHRISVTSRRYRDHKYEDPIQYRNTEEREREYKRHRIRRSGDSFKSDNTDSSGYRSGSSTYECRSDRSSKSEYYCTSLYKNDHYKDVNKEIYKPVKISKEQRYKLQLYDDSEDIKSERLKSYLNDAEQAQKNQNTAQKKAGIRNYTPKILSEDEQRKKIESWI